MKKYIQPRIEEICLFTESMLAGSDPKVAIGSGEHNGSVENSGWTNKKDGGMFGSSDYWSADE